MESRTDAYQAAFTSHTAIVEAREEILRRIKTSIGTNLRQIVSPTSRGKCANRILQAGNDLCDASVQICRNEKPVRMERNAVRGVGNRNVPIYAPPSCPGRVTIDNHHGIPGKVREEELRTAWLKRDPVDKFDSSESDKAVSRAGVRIHREDIAWAGEAREAVRPTHIDEITGLWVHGDEEAIPWGTENLSCG